MDQSEGPTLKSMSINYTEIKMLHWAGSLTRLNKVEWFEIGFSFVYIPKTLTEYGFHLLNFDLTNFKLFTYNVVSALIQNLKKCILFNLDSFRVE